MTKMIVPSEMTDTLIEQSADTKALPALAGFDPLSLFFVNAYTDTMHNAFVFGRQ